jgi:hypothetical protein
VIAVTIARISSALSAVFLPALRRRRPPARRSSRREGEALFEII